MKNLPTELVSNIKSYEKKSDYTKQTGIDDGNEETVLDIGLKKRTERKLGEQRFAGLRQQRPIHGRSVREPIYRP